MASEETAAEREQRVCRIVLFAYDKRRYLYESYRETEEGKECPQWAYEDIAHVVRMAIAELAYYGREFSMAEAMRRIIIEDIANEGRPSK